MKGSTEARTRLLTRCDAVLGRALRPLPHPVVNPERTLPHRIPDSRLLMSLLQALGHLLLLPRLILTTPLNIGGSVPALQMKH